MPMIMVNHTALFYLTFAAEGLVRLHETEINERTRKNLESAIKHAEEVLGTVVELGGGAR